MLEGDSRQEGFLLACYPYQFHPSITGRLWPPCSFSIFIQLSLCPSAVCTPRVQPPLCRLSLGSGGPSLDILGFYNPVSFLCFLVLGCCLVQLLSLLHHCSLFSQSSSTYNGWWAGKYLITNAPGKQKETWFVMCTHFCNIGHSPCIIFNCPTWHRWISQVDVNSLCT